MIVKSHKNVKIVVLIQAEVQDQQFFFCFEIKRRHILPANGLLQ